MKPVGLLPGPVDTTVRSRVLSAIGRNRTDTLEVLCVDSNRGARTSRSMSPDVPSPKSRSVMRAAAGRRPIETRLGDVALDAERNDPLIRREPRYPLDAHPVEPAKHGAELAQDTLSPTEGKAAPQEAEGSLYRGVSSQRW
jgi:hypothetical protein